MASTIDKNHSFKNMQRALGLTRTISLQEARMIPFQQLGSSAEDVPFLMIEKLMRGYEWFRDLNITDISFHRMDIAILVFTSCDLMLRQMLVQKMALCRMAIPFLIPNPDGHLELSFWPLRSINLEWIDMIGQSIEASLVKHPFRVVSFLRIGDIHLSKSRILNEIMLSSNTIQTFFTRDGHGGNKKRSISNGTVEMSYMFTVEDGRNNLNEGLIYLNLRGDVLNGKKQRDVLCKMSSVIVCFIEKDKLDDNDSCKVLSDIQSMCPHVMLLVLADGVNNNANETILNNIDTSKFKIVNNCGADGEKLTFSEFVNTIKNNLCEFIAMKPLIIIQEQKELFQEMGIEIDEDKDRNFLHAKQYAEDIANEVKNMEIVKMKQLVLPLQGDLLQRWTSQMKEKYRGKGMTVEQLQLAKSEIDGSMNTIRKQQFEKAKQLHSLLERFIHEQSNLSRDQTASYFKLLQIELDDISRSIMPKLREEYQNRWEERETHPEELKLAEKTLDASSFGLEHLFREMGQLYECTKHCAEEGSQDILDVANLPKLASQYLLSGHALEFMDGDTSVVPLVWIKAVLEHIAKLIGDKKMYVLSVVGVQSSGKSTLLNTMFGLELAVGAGRCTRGIFAQLLPVGQASSKLQVDYILVLDSEGLCGIDIKNQCNRDNEIATLVIGLADIAIVNIKGENCDQMQSILEIAVHAFIRMKALKNFKMQKCIFVHQSVTVSEKHPNLKREQRQLQLNLDKIAKEAAGHENLGAAVTKFNHVIDFDCDKNVFNLPNVWTGTPPMAQVAPGYSIKIKEIRSFILKGIELSAGTVKPKAVNETKQYTYSVTAKQMQTRLEDMWNGVLADDFLFSFKNSMSVNAYLILEKEYYTTTRAFEGVLTDLLNNICIKELEVCENSEHLNTIYEQQKTVIQEKGDEERISHKAKLVEMFDTHKMKAFLQIWRTSKVTFFDESTNKIIQRVTMELQKYKELKQEELEQVHSKKSFITNKAKSLAEEMKHKQCTEEAITEQFNAFWETIEMNMEVTSKPISNIREDIQGALYEIFKTRGHVKYLKEEMPDYWEGVNDQSVERKITEENLKKDHIANKKFPEGVSEIGKYNKPTVYVPRQKSRESFYPQVVREMNEVLEKVQQKIKSLTSTYTVFTPLLIHQLLQFIMEKIDGHNALSFAKSEFTLTPQFEAMIAIKVARIAVLEFETLSAKVQWIDKRKMAFKQQLQNIFTNTVNDKLNELLVDYLVDIIRKQIFQHMDNTITRKAADLVLTKLKSTKHGLLVNVLTSLAQKKSFDEYVRFTNDMYSYCTQWVKKETASILLSKTNSQKQYSTLAQEELGGIKTHVIAAIKKASSKSQSSGQMTDFIVLFCEKIKSKIAISDSECAFLREQKVANLNDFQILLEGNLEELCNDVMKIYKVDTLDGIIWNGDAPEQQVMTALWGCRETCPCCKAPCMYTESKHLEEGENHRCLQHWPGGLTGTVWVETRELSTAICNFLVGSTSRFRCSACRKVCRDSGNCKAEGGGFEVHPYREYKKYIKGWDIECDDTGEASMYWQWVMNVFESDFVRRYNANGIKIPPMWKNVDDTKAILDLHKYTTLDESPTEDDEKILKD